MKLFVALFTVIPLVFVGVGYHMVQEQHQKITTFQPVPAEVQSAHVATIRSRDSDGDMRTSYKPVVRYRYEVDGRRHTSETVTVLDETMARFLAQGIVDRYAEGGQVEAYVNPEDPTDAFLLREYTFFPYVFMLFPMLFLAVGVGVGVGVVPWRRPPEPQPALGEWYEVRPVRRLKDKRNAALIVAATWQILGYLAYGHYFRVAEPPYGWFAVISTGVYIALGLIPIGVFIYYYRLSAIMRDATLLMDRPYARLGEDLTVCVMQDVFRNMHIDAVEATLICDRTSKRKRRRKTSISTHACHEDKATLLDSEDLQGGSTLEAQHTFRVPETQHPTSPQGFKEYPRYAWRVEVSVKIPNQPDYAATFPIDVQSPAEP